MISRLQIGGSRENLNGAYDEQVPKTPRSLGRKPSKSNVTQSPPPSFKGLNAKRSIPNVANGSSPYPNVVVATPPPRPLSQSLLAQSQFSPSPTPPPLMTTSSSHASDETIGSTGTGGAGSLARRGTRNLSPADSLSNERRSPHRLH